MYYLSSFFFSLYLLPSSPSFDWNSHHTWYPTEFAQEKRRFFRFFPPRLSFVSAFSPNFRKSNIKYGIIISFFFLFLFDKILSSQRVSSFYWFLINVLPSLKLGCASNITACNYSFLHSRLISFWCRDNFDGFFWLKTWYSIDKLHFDRNTNIFRIFLLIEFDVGQFQIKGWENSFSSKCESKWRAISSRESLSNWKWFLKQHSMSIAFFFYHKMVFLIKMCSKIQMNWSVHPIALLFISAANNRSRFIQKKSNRKKKISSGRRLFPKTSLM